MGTFYRLSTSNGRPLLPEHPALGDVYDYLEHVRIGVSGRPLCPYVAQIHVQDGYYVQFKGDPCEQIDLEAAAEELRAEFKRVSPSMTHATQDLDPRAVVIAFCHPSCRESIFGEMLEKLRKDRRNSFLAEGLMISPMYEGHADPRGDGGYKSRIPLLIVRRMHKWDIVFMKTEEERALYGQFFA